ncbi:linear amide C-N hydrolase [Streptococcus panodentis]|nr:linear amide C-N hydrolase [Streptococcus panodentis]
MCTTFSLNKDRLVGQNYDFYFGHGCILFNPKNLKKYTPVQPPQKPLTWLSSFNSLTFNQFGCEFPTGGMNDQGLVAAIMFDEDGIFPKEEASSGLSELQWVQYQLDNFATVAEVRDHLSETLPFAQFMPLHYTLADASGQSLIVEFVDGQPVLHDDQDFHVLTNTNLERTQQEAQDPPQTIDKDRDLSVRRYASLMADFARDKDQTADVDQAFDYLNRVAFLNQEDNIGFNFMLQEEVPVYTYWSIVYDSQQKQIYLKTYDHPDLKVFSLEKMAERYQRISMLDIETSQAGDLSQALQPFDPALNRSMIAQSYSQLAPDLPSQVLDWLSTYPQTFRRKGALMQSLRRLWGRA